MNLFSTKIFKELAKFRVIKEECDNAIMFMIGGLLLC